MRSEQMVEEIQRMLDGGVNFYKTSSVGTSSYASSTVQNPAALTLDGLMQMTRLLEADEPARVFMKKHGFDPDAGDRIFLPESVKAEFGPCPPAYVEFSIYITTAVMVRGSAVGVVPKEKPITYRFDWSL